MSQFLFHQHHYIYYIQLKSSIPSIICTYFFLIASQLHRHRFSGSEPLNHWTVPPWKKRRVSKTVMGLGTHLDQLGGGEFQHNPCSDERINIPLAMDIAAFEIHVIQLMMGSFIFLFDLCFFSRDSSSSTGKKWVAWDDLGPLCTQVTGGTSEGCGDFFLGMPEADIEKVGHGECWVPSWWNLEILLVKPRYYPRLEGQKTQNTWPWFHS